MKANFTWAVWKGEFEDNDSCDWYDDHDDALAALHALGEELEEGETATMLKHNADTGDVAEDFGIELRNEDGEINEYRDGERAWL